MLIIKASCTTKKCQQILIDNRSKINVFREVVGKAVLGSYFGHGDGPVWQADVGCHGNESDITDCGSSWSGGVNCDHSRDAGVICSCEFCSIIFNCSLY